MTNRFYIEESPIGPTLMFNDIIVRIWTDNKYNEGAHGLCDKLNKTMEDDNKATIVWSVDDVLFQARNNNIVITEDEAREVLHDVINNHDADYGISWGTFDHYIEEILNNRDKCR